ncbi:MAG: fumarylacetoacetate hydrolase family protein [Rhodospirillaceae bacterium]|jgi:2-keto-4-pentenoate hydratase/2-oxohepta-3-ene-1,7-dioic acid hydratase in catechol pathway|nr:fumarylacetoacetate hydrolase family protein [Rhodospirillaceae bacterium]MBT3810668.1 fumarylacetoacetate hydrolase family protein [Rhodospirillaceae bacterium]MBT3931353.1 fumarylacetoacetate hydrolase family protein [Rhodospirillaceae bacterium]MBT5357029.1 fumarylacetoacetate hydrolase family protein [Rhodospirillaceae bacterium]MBT5770905.1 fumarylacetoacetate hydrolase family protein [Rhodospirillaceae bacterium]
MKLATIERDTDHAHVAVVTADNELLDLVALRGTLAAATAVPAEMRKLLAGGAAALAAVQSCLDAVAGMSPDEQAALRSSGVLQAWDDASFLPVVPDPSIILSVGMNYRAHLDEMENIPTPKNPPAFLMTHPALNGHRKPIIAPAQCPDMIDYEGELTLVFGKSCHNIEEAEAMDYVAGYTIANDVSARDWVGAWFAATEPMDVVGTWDRNLLGKQLPTFCPLGPVIVTKDEISDPHDLQLTTTLNGEVMQSTNTDDLIFNLPQLISYFSKFYRFSPGDVITTGSPSGVGAGRKPPVFMKPGDLIEVEISGIGKLSNTIAAA